MIKDTYRTGLSWRGDTIRLHRKQCGNVLCHMLQLCFRFHLINDADAQMYILMVTFGWFGIQPSLVCLTS